MHSLPSLLNFLAQKNVQLVVVSKGRSLDEILRLYHLGIRDFGENKVQEALLKIPLLPSDIRWHFIGRLQKNKVNKILNKFYLIHSVDSLELCAKIAKASAGQRILLQVNVSKEQSKGGFFIEDLKNCFGDMCHLADLNIQGLMTIAPKTDDQQMITHCFEQLKQLQTSLQKQHPNMCQLNTLSMGMSEDYLLAIEAGATLVRIGRAIFDAAAK